MNLRYILMGWYALCLCTVTAQKTDYVLIFSARSPSWKPFSVGGHAFVSWATLAADNQLHIAETYGFYPGKNKSMWDALTSLEAGRVVRGFLINSNGKRLYQLKVQVDSVVWTQSLCNAEGWNGRSYNLIYNNCSDFLSDIAEAAGLKTPATHNCLGLPRKPVVFIKKLWRKNKKRLGRLYEGD
jgi:hypothetical protein